jgi:predicted nuclease of predicted toxin-antitoxin system
LSHYLCSRGCDCTHVEDVGLSKASDSDIWSYAGENECIVISKDEDFLYLAKSAESRARFLWVRLGNCRMPALLKAIARLWPRIEASLAAGDRVVELR